MSATIEQRMQLAVVVVVKVPKKQRDRDVTSDLLWCRLQVDLPKIESRLENVNPTPAINLLQSSSNFDQLYELS